MRIALDFDGVIHDITAVKQRYARLVHGVDLERAAVWRPRVLEHLTEAEHAAMIEAAHMTPLGHDGDAMEGALEAISRLVADDHDLYVVTARNDGEIPFAREWLRALGVPLRQIRHTRRASKLEYCLALGVSVLFDDHPHVLRDLEGSSVHPVLLRTPYNAHLEAPVGATAVADWSAFVALCAERASMSPAQLVG